jgi:hypothetical protein
MQTIAATRYQGRRVMFSGELKTRDAGRAQLWMRIDGPDHRVLAFDNMSAHPVTGTRPWRRYDVVLNVPKNSVDIAFGFLLAGRGKAWGSDFALRTVGLATAATSRGPLLPLHPENLNFKQ